MNNSFLEFINQDIESKKEILSSMPTKTKTNIKKYNAFILDIEKKYNEYRSSTRNYLLAKAKAFQINEEPKEDKLSEKIENLEYIKFLLNPTNTYVEKMGLDTLLYQISNYYTLNFNSLNEIINSFLDKFESAGIFLEADDFNYTCYVHEYMASFLEVRRKKTNNYDRVSEIFEQIYWVNPEIIEHVELNFRKLIKLNERKLNAYIEKLQKEAMDKYGISSYAYCLEKLQAAYIDLNLSNRETVGEIVSKAKSGEFDIREYLEDSKVRKQAFSTLVPENSDLDNVCASLEKLMLNVDEYDNYIEFSPIFKDFKEEYEKLLNFKEEYKGLKNIEDEIAKKEAELEKINRKIFNNKPSMFSFVTDLKKLKMESVLKAKEIYTLYENYDKELFKDRVMKSLSRALTVADVLHLYYSYDYFKKLAIQKVYKLTNYEDIIKYSDSFDLYAMNASNIIITGVPIFDEVDIPKIIVNRYRLNNIKITEDDLNPDTLKSLKNKIELVLRINRIEKSETTIDKIWFMVQVEKIINKEKNETM